MKKLLLFLFVLSLTPILCHASDYKTTLEQKVFSYVNKERVKNGLKPLKASAKLSQIASAHSTDMAKRDYTSHVTPEGLSPNDRAKKAGYNIRLEKKNSTRIGVGENIAQHQSYMEENGVESPYLEPVDQMAWRIVRGWMNSEGHRKNILNGDYTLVGTGASISKDKKIRVTQVFF